MWSRTHKKAYGTLNNFLQSHPTHFTIQGSNVSLVSTTGNEENEVKEDSNTTSSDAQQQQPTQQQSSAFDPASLTDDQILEVLREAGLPADGGERILALSFYLRHSLSFSE